MINKKYTIKKDVDGFEFPMEIDKYMELRDSLPAMVCSECNLFLNSIYIDIILTLEYSKFLPDDFKPLCCECYDQINHKKIFL